MTDIESPLVQPLTATVGFARKTAVNGQYNNNEISLYFPVELPRVEDFDGDLEAYYKQVDGAIKTGFTTVKGHIYEQLGIEFEDRNGVLIEKLAASFPESTPAAPASRPSAPAAAPAPGAPTACPQCSGTAFYDNRPKKASGEYKAKAPDFKCRGCQKGIWL